MDTPTNGPFPESFAQVDGNQVEIVYDQPFTYNNFETSGMMGINAAVVD